MRPDITDASLQNIVTGGFRPLLSVDQIIHLPPPEPLIEDILMLDSIGVLYGTIGAGKSVVGLDWQLHISLGKSWYGRKVTAGPTLYIVGEGVPGTGLRLRAWRQHYGINVIPNAYFGDMAPNILTEQGREQLYYWVEEAQPILTIVDTVARVISGGQENDFSTMSTVVEVLDTIRQMTGGCALGIAHPGKNEELGIRGHSALKGAVDTEIRATNGPALTITKQRNGKEGIIGKFNLKVIDLEPGKTGVVLEQSKGSKLGKNEDFLVQALASLGGDAMWAGFLAAAIDRGCPKGSFGAAKDKLLKDSILFSYTDDTGTHYSLDPPLDSA